MEQCNRFSGLMDDEEVEVSDLLPEDMVSFALS
jgi:hypothetical protein